jgi:hypothetical protein
MPRDSFLRLHASPERDHYGHNHTHIGLLGLHRRWAGAGIVRRDTVLVLEGWEAFVPASVGPDSTRSIVRTGGGQARSAPRSAVRHSNHIEPAVLDAASQKIAGR